MPTGFYKRFEFDPDLQRVKRRQIKSRNSQNMVISYFQQMRPDCTIESYCTTGTQRRIDCFNANGFCGHCNAVFEAVDCFYQHCLCQDLQPALTEENIRCGSKTGKWMKCRDSFSSKKNTLLSKSENVDGGISTIHWYVSKWIPEKIIPLEASIASKPDVGQNKIKHLVWSRSLWYRTSRTCKRTVCKSSAIYQNCKRL